MSHLQAFKKSVGRLSQLKCGVASHKVDPAAVRELCRTKRTVTTKCMRCRYPLKLVMDEKDPNRYHIREN